MIGHVSLPISTIGIAKTRITGTSKCRGEIGVSKASSVFIYKIHRLF